MKQVLSILTALLTITFVNAQIVTQEIECGIINPDRFEKITINAHNSKEPITVNAAIKDGQAFIQGGILVKDLNKVENRSIVCDICGTWPDGIIPYEIDANANYSQNMLNQITAAIQQINDETNVTIVPRTTENHFVKIINGTGCYSSIGNTQLNGGQTLSLKEPGCTTVKTIMHEFFHSAGIFHEQCRSDRDQNVVVNYSNINPNYISNFDTLPNYSEDIGDYDIHSIMHYSYNAFSINGQPTIQNLDGSTDGIGQNTGQLTQSDIDGINSLYQSSSLPVRWGKFEVENRGNSNTLTWSTLSEINNDGFYVQRSMDGEQFEDIKFVAAKGHLNAEQSYTFSDFMPYDGINYYRLKQVDYDGNSDYSKIISVEIKGSKEFKIFPSITSDKLNIQGYHQSVITLYRANGQRIQKNIANGSMDVTDLEAGAYFIKSSEEASMKFIKI